MSLFSSLFAPALDLLASASGEAAVYRSRQGEPSNITVIAGKAQVLKVIGKSGVKKLWRRAFTIRRNELDAPLVSASIVFDGETWPITGYEARTSDYTRVTCEIEQDRTKSREGLRQ